MKNYKNIVLVTFLTVLMGALGIKLVDLYRLESSIVYKNYSELFSEHSKEYVVFTAVTCGVCSELLQELEEQVIFP